MLSLELRPALNRGSAMPESIS